MEFTLPGADADNSVTPPALPTKQRRSQRSSASSISDLQLEERTGTSSPTPSCTDVFVTPTDCHAVQCPVHQYGHKVRFFSDENPPPIPKKRLLRTLSLPAVKHCNPAQRHASPPRCGNSHHEADITPANHAGEDKKEATVDRHHLNQLESDTPDHHLPEVFGGYSHQEEVYTGIRNNYLRFMKSAVRHMENMVLLEEQEIETVMRLQPEDYVLSENDQPKMTEPEVCFTVNCPEVPTRFLSAKVNRRGSDLKHSTPLPNHPNTEEIIVHFPPCIAKERLQLSELPASTELPQEGSTEPCQESTSITKRCTVLSLMEQGFTVTIVRDFPWGTLDDFVQEGVSLHRSQPDVYERRLSLLMLQLVQGLCHLRSQDVLHSELRPQSIKLVFWSTKNNGPAETDESPAGPRGAMRRYCLPRRSYAGKSDGWDDVLYENVSRKKVHVLWEKWGTPRVVISHDAARTQGPPDLPSEELQLGRLLKHSLHRPADAHLSTQYTPGLRHLIQQLTSETPGLRLADTARVLQAVLWGPRAGLFEKNQASTVTVHNWLMVKRSLLILKLAEKGLFLDQRGVDWEDYLCLQYLSSADPETLLETAIQLGIHNPVKSALMTNTSA
ncbi:inactive tyrosine-protein kinase PRAG1 isoform X2 [Brachyhypopomus gauderio]|uniref:inactive tyrosine-protein kinase PRAG1 isoform X2 n=1 Tax=Brachyhypopomus gauderio TaxID=698409 RepID=UPI0040438C62